MIVPLHFLLYRTIIMVEVMRVPACYTLSGQCSGKSLNLSPSSHTINRSDIMRSNYSLNKGSFD